MGLEIYATRTLAATIDDLEYDIRGETITITDCNQRAAQALEIPSKIEAKHVTSIGAAAFQGCSSLTSVTIPDGVTSIGDGAFGGCSSLSAISIPASVTSIGEHVFSECSSLKTLTTPKENPNYSSVSGILYNKSQTLLHTYPAGKTNDNVTIPNSVTAIGASAFYFSTHLTTITIPDHVTSIGAFAFYNCSRLRKITLPQRIPMIGENVFTHCRSLTSISIPKSVTSIGVGAFSNCGKLRSITIPGSVTSIGEGAFYECRRLTNISLPNSVSTIGDRAFSYCTSLTNITIPKSVTSMHPNAYSWCLRLTNIVFQGNAPTYDHRTPIRSPLDGPLLRAIVTARPDATGFGATFGGLPVVIAAAPSTITNMRIDAEGNFILKLDGSNVGIKLLHSRELKSAFTEVSHTSILGNDQLVIESTATELQGSYGFFRISN